jgi:DNA-binding transcriptional regulator YiaG
MASHWHLKPFISSVGNSSRFSRLLGDNSCICAGVTKPMTKEEYRKLREKKCGSQVEAARRLKVSVRTIQRRESGKMPITQVAAAFLRQQKINPKLKHNKS